MQNSRRLFSTTSVPFSLKRMSQNPKSSRNLLFGVILLFAVVGFAAISATIVKVSLSAVILVLVAFAEAGLIILGLIMVQTGQEASVRNQENVSTELG